MNADWESTSDRPYDPPITRKGRAQVMEKEMQVFRYFPLLSLRNWGVRGEGLGVKVGRDA